MDVVDLVSLIDRFDSPASVLPYLEHPDPRVRLAVAQWFGPGLEGTDAWIRRKSVDLYPRMGAVEGRPDMPVGLFTALVADPDPQVRMAALHRCWDVGLLVGLVDPRALLAGTAAETAGDPVARLVRVHLLLLREAGDHEVSAAAALALDPSLAPASGTGAPTAGPGPRHLVLEPRAQARGPLEVASWQDWADRCARFGIPELPVCRGQIVFTMLSVPLGRMPAGGQQAVAAHLWEHLEVLVGHGGAVGVSSEVTEVVAPLAPEELSRRTQWLEGSYRVETSIAPFDGLPPEVIVTATISAVAVESADPQGWRDSRLLLERLWAGRYCRCGGAIHPPEVHR